MSEMTAARAAAMGIPANPDGSRTYKLQDPIKGNTGETVEEITIGKMRGRVAKAMDQVDGGFQKYYEALAVITGIAVPFLQGDKEGLTMFDFHVLRELIDFFSGLSQQTGTI